MYNIYILCIYRESSFYELVTRIFSSYPRFVVWIPPTRNIPRQKKTIGLVVPSCAIRLHGDVGGSPIGIWDDRGCPQVHPYWGI